MRFFVFSFSAIKFLLAFSLSIVFCFSLVCVGTFSPPLPPYIIGLPLLSMEVATPENKINRLDAMVHCKRVRLTDGS